MTLKLDIGCGINKKPEFIGIDIKDYSNLYQLGSFIKHDLNKGLKKFKNNSVSEIYARHFLEHILNKNFVMAEIIRVCKNNAKINIIVPHFSSYMSFQNEHIWHFRSDAFSDNALLTVINSKICFGKRFNLINYILELLVNLNKHTKRFYEITGLRNLFPADELKIEFRKNDR